MELSNRIELEQAWSRQVSRMAARHRSLIRQHWGDPPDPTAVPVEVWEQIRRDQQNEALTVLYLLFLASATAHSVRLLGTEPSAPLQALLAQRAEAWSRSRAERMAESWVNGSRQRLLDAAVEQQQAVAQPGGRRWTLYEWGRRLRDALAPERLEAAVVTGTTEAQSAGGDALGRLTGLLSDADLWQTEQDERVCPVCSPLHGRPRKTWAMAFPDGPPAHPNCRCHIAYRAELPDRASRGRFM